METIENRIGFCPVCGRELKGCYSDKPEFSDDYFFFEWFCKCVAEGNEYYSYDFSDQSNIIYDGEEVDVYNEDELNTVRKKIKQKERKNKLLKIVKEV